MLPTPNISHLTPQDYNRVYEPAEDTFLLLDALEQEHSFLNSLCPTVCLEIGCGSGVVSTFLASQIVGDHNAFYLCTDINEQAASITKSTASQNNVDVNPVVMDLAGALLYRLQHQVDILIFNPPYVVTPSDEVGSKGIEASWAGGIQGREVTDQFWGEVPRLLSDKGVFYLVIIKENNPAEIDTIMQSYGFEMTVLMERRSGPERLAILKFVRKKLY